MYLLMVPNSLFFLYDLLAMIASAILAICVNSQSFGFYFFPSTAVYVCIYLGLIFNFY